MMKCLIIEDEKPAQDLLKGYINRTPFLNCIGTFESGLAINPSQLNQTSIIFLDIQLPELNGMSFIKTLLNPPQIIITTAFTDYAVEAFDIEVADYLLKPFSFERYFRAVSRVRNKVISNNKESEERIFIYADKTHYQIHIDDIRFVKAEVDYVRIHTSQQNYLVLDSLRNWIAILENRGFLQIHRSYLVNIGKISKISGNQLFIDDQIIPIGKKHKEDLMKRINYR